MPQMITVRWYDRTSAVLAGMGLLLLVAAMPAAGSAQPHPPAFDLAALQQEQSLKDWMRYLPDPERRLSGRNAADANGWRSLTVERLGYMDYPVWTWLRLTNSDDRPIEAVLFNQRPMVQLLDVYVWHDGRLIQRHDIGLSRSNASKNAIISRLSHIVAQVPPGQTWTVITKLDTLGAVDAAWQAATMNRFTRQNVHAFLILGLYCGIMLALIVHGIVSAVSLGQPQFRYLVGYGLCFMLYLSLINGMRRVFDMKMPGAFDHVGTVDFFFASFMFWIAFTQYFLNTWRTLPRLHRCLNGFKIVFGAGVVIYPFSPWIKFVNMLLPVWSALIIMLCATILVTGTVAVYRRLPHAWFYFLGHAVVFTASVLLAVILQTNAVQNLYWILLVQPFIVIIHISVMSLSLGMTARRAQTELAHQQQIMLEQSRFTAVGKTIGMVVHQWRTPLARLGAQLMELHAYVRHSDPSPTQAAMIRQDLLPGMQRSMKTLKDTVDDFSDFFSARQPSEHFEPAQVVDQVLEMIEGRRRACNVAMVWRKPTRPLTLFGRPSSLAHVLMVLLENAMDMLAARNVDAPQVVVQLEGNEQQIVLTVADNAGGIDFQPVERVFETFVSGKGEHHMGMGLAIAGRLVQERMRGSIAAQNVPDGTRFTVKLPRSRPNRPKQA